MNFILFLLICVFGANNSYVYQVIMQKYWPSIWVPILLVVLINGVCNFYFIFLICCKEPIWLAHHKFFLKHWALPEKFSLEVFPFIGCASLIFGNNWGIKCGAIVKILGNKVGNFGTKLGIHKKHWEHVGNTKIQKK